MASDGWNAMILGLNTDTYGNGGGYSTAQHMEYPSATPQQQQPAMPTSLDHSGASTAIDWANIGISDAELAAQLDLWTNAQFTFDGPAPYMYGPMGEEEVKPSEAAALPPASSAVPQTTSPVASGRGHPVFVNKAGDDLKTAERRRVHEAHREAEQRGQQVLGPDVPRQATSQSMPSPSITTALFDADVARKSNDVHSTNQASIGRAVSTTSPVLDHGHDGSNSDASAGISVEEDKRRRNTAASHRFRLKKKAREEALVRSAAQADERIRVLESHISDLERENRWLKSLVVEKYGESVLDSAGSVKSEVTSHMPHTLDVHRHAAKRGIGTLQGM